MAPGELSYTRDQGTRRKFFSEEPSRLVLWTWLKYEKFQIKSSWVPDNSCRFVAQYFKDTALTLNGGHFTLSTSSGTTRLILLP